MPVAASSAPSKNMRRIKMLTGISGNRKNGTPFSYTRGDKIEWDATEAARFIERGYAVPAEDDDEK